jgi:hypothetical protein
MGQSLATLDPSLKAEGERRAEAAWAKLEAGERANTLAPWSQGTMMSSDEAAALAPPPVAEPKPAKQQRKERAAPEPKKPVEPRSVEEEPIEEDVEAPEQTNTDEKPTGESSAEEEAERERKLTILNRSKLPKSVIERMSAEEIEQFVESQGKQLGDSDNAFRELRALKNTREESAAKKNETVDPTPTVVPIDFAVAVKPLVESGEFGAEAEPHLRKFAEAIAAPLVNELGRRDAVLRALDTAFGRLSREFGDLASERVREQLLGEVPELKDPAFYARVRTKMQTLAKTGDYAESADTAHERIRLVMHDAIYTILGDSRKTNADKKVADKRRSSGQVRPQSSKRTKDEMSLDERMREGWERLGQGEDPRAIHADLFAGR